MIDIFEIIQNDNDISDNHIKKILNNDNIDELNINWANYLHKSYQYNFDINKLSDIINKSLKRILTNSSDDKNIVDKINCLNRFYHINSLFEIINELYLSYNNITGLKDYTLITLQNYYINFIIENEYLAKHWFNGIINMSNVEDITICRYYKGINILKYYINDNMINKIIYIYSKYVSEFFIDNFNTSKITLVNIFNKLNKIDNINRILFNNNDNKRKIFIDYVTDNLTILWEKYLDNNIINNDVVKYFNNIKLNNNFIDITKKYIIKWLSNIKSNINISNYCNHNLFIELISIGSLIIYFKSGINKIDEIMIIREIYNDPILLEYIMIGLNQLINKSYNDLLITTNIINSIAIISIYEDTSYILNLYMKYIEKRLDTLIRNNKININIIKYELSILNNFEYCNHFEKIKLYLNNYINSIEHKNIINNCKINYIDINNKKISYNEINLDKINYYVLDKQFYNEYNNIIKEEFYPKNIINNLSIGKTYYDKILKTTKIDWDIENSLINYKIKNMIINSTILYYIILYHINNKDYNINELINTIGNNHILLEKYIKYLININIIIIESNILKINDLNREININYIVNDKIKDIIETKEIINMTDECLRYLRLIYITKMFKTNSTKEFDVNNIIKDLELFINNYISHNSINNNIKNIIKNLIYISNDELINNLNSLEKRDIIEKINDNIFKYVI